MNEPEKQSAAPMTKVRARRDKGAGTGAVIAAALLAVMASVAASGCAITTMTLYAPAHERVSSAMQVGQGREILLMPFTDERLLVERCGMKKNSYNMDTADIRCAVPPNQWLTALLAAELRAAGFVVLSEPSQAGPETLRLETWLSKFFIEAKVGAVTNSPEADLELRMVASTRTGLDAQRHFYFKGEEGAAFALESNFQAAADDAVRQMLAGVVGAVVQLVQRYPQLGLPARGAAVAAADREVGR